MKAVNIDEVLKILYKYGEFLFITDYPKYREMQNEIANLPKITDNTDEVLDKIKAEIKEWYWQADKQALVKDPCVVNAMVDLFIRTINKYKESEEK